MQLVISRNGSASPWPMTGLLGLAVYIFREKWMPKPFSVPSLATQEEVLKLKVGVDLLNQVLELLDVMAATPHPDNQPPKSPKLQEVERLRKAMFAETLSKEAEALFKDLKDGVEKLRVVAAMLDEVAATHYPFRDPPKGPKK